MALIWVASASERSIIGRHDRPDSAFLALGEQYPGIVHVNLPTPQGAGDGEGRATGGRTGRYGVVEYYVRVSRYVAWIEGVTKPLAP